MKKALKILIYFLGFLVLLNLLIIVFYDSIVRFALKRAVSYQTEGQVTLSIEEFDLDLMKGRVRMSAPELLFDTIPLDSSQSFAVNRIRFDQLIIDSLDIRTLLLNRDIVAKKFTVQRPQFWFLERGRDMQRSFHPERLIKTLNSNPPALAGTEIAFQVVEINYGSIQVSEYAHPELDPGKVEFTLIFKDFDTSPDSTSETLRYLFAEELQVKVKKLKRELRSGYMLEIDSALISTSKRDLVAGGIRLTPNELLPDKQAIALEARKLQLNDIDLEEVRGLEDLNLHSVIVSGGHITNYHPKDFKYKSDSTTGKGVKMLSTVLHTLELDTILVSNFCYFDVLGTTDTLLSTEITEFLTTGIRFDSSAFPHVIRNVRYDEASLVTGPLDTRLIEGIELSYNKLNYSTATAQLELDGLRVTGDQDSSMKSLEFYFPKLYVDDLSLPKLQNNVLQEVALRMEAPDIDLDLEHVLLNRTDQTSSFPLNQLFRLGSVEIDNGKIEVARGQDFETNFQQVDLLLEGLRTRKGDSLAFDFKELFFQCDQSIVSIEAGKQILHTSAVVFDDRLLSIANLSGSYIDNQTGGRNHFGMRQLNMEGIDLRSLISRQNIKLDRLKLWSPFFDGQLHFLKKADTVPAVFPIDLEFLALEMINGRFEGGVQLDTLQFNIAAGYDLKLGGMSLRKGDSVSQILNQLNWELELSQLLAEAVGHRLVAEQLLSSSLSSEFAVSGLKVEALQEQSMLSGFRIDSLDVPSLNISNTRYDLLLKQDSMAFGRIDLVHPLIKLNHRKTSLESGNNADKIFNLRDYLFFSYDSLNVSGMNMEFRNKGPFQNSTVAISDLHLSHIQTKDQVPNSLTNMDLSLDLFTFRDSVQERMLEMTNAKLYPGNGAFFIERLQGGDLVKDLQEDSGKVGLTGSRFDSRRIVFSDIQLRDALPSDMRIGKLSIGDFDLNVFSQANGAGKSKLKLKLEILRRFSKTLTRLNVDTVEMENVHLAFNTADTDSTDRNILIDSLGIMVNRITLDTAMIDQKNPDIIGSLVVDLKGRTTVSGDSLYEIRTGLLHYDFPERKMVIDSVVINPRYIDTVFFDKAVYQTDRARIRGSRIEFNALDIDKYLQEDHLHFGNIHIEGFNVDLKRDKRYKFAPGLIREFPREQLMSINQKFTIDSVILSDIKLRYEEIEEKTGQPGYIYFDSIYGKAKDLTNVLEPGDRSSRLFVDLQGRVMGQTQMNLSAYFPLYPDTIAFWLSGSSERMEMQALNTITENLLGIGIIKGRGSVDIPLIIATDSVATGYLTFRYKKLRLAMYNRKKEQLNKGFISPLFNFLINDLVVRSNNPRFARKPKIGQVYFERDTRKGVVNYAWKSILSGMLSTLGFNTKEQRQEKREMKRNQ